MDPCLHYQDRSFTLNIAPHCVTFPLTQSCAENRCTDSMARLSGLQREVLSLYRKCLREIRKKPVVSQNRLWSNNGNGRSVWYGRCTLGTRKPDRISKYTPGALRPNRSLYTTDYTIEPSFRSTWKSAKKTSMRLNICYAKGTDRSRCILHRAYATSANPCGDASIRCKRNAYLDQLVSSKALYRAVGQQVGDSITSSRLINYLKSSCRQPPPEAYGIVQRDRVGTDMSSINTLDSARILVPVLGLALSCWITRW